MKSGRRGVMFIHQTLPDAGSTTSDGGNFVPSGKKRGRPKKVKLTDRPQQQTIANTSVAAASSVIRDTSSCTNNGSGVEEASMSPTPLQIDLSPKAVNDNEQNNTGAIASYPAPNTIMDHTSTPVDIGPPPPLAPVPTKRQRARKFSGTGKMTYGEQAKAVEAGE